jgi:hypothetical protein
MSYLDQLHQELARTQYDSAIVSYVGKVAYLKSGKLGKVTNSQPDEVKYGIRSKAHVEIYGLTVLATNYI